MKLANDILLVQRLAPVQRGVFSKADLQTALAEPHQSAFVRRLQALEQADILRRFVRGWYVANPFDLATLSQRIAPDSYVSLGWVLAKKLLVGTRPERRITAVKIGKARRYSNLGYDIEHFSLNSALHFGYARENDGIQYANAEKAVLDAQYFHLRGKRFDKPVNPFLMNWFKTT